MKEEIEKKMREEIEKKELERILEEARIQEEEMKDFLLSGVEEKEIKDFFGFKKDSKTEKTDSKTEEKIKGRKTMERLFIFILVISLSLIFAGCTGTQTIRMGGTFQDAESGNTYTGEIEYVWNQGRTITEALPIVTETFGGNDSVIIPIASIEASYAEKKAGEKDTGKEAGKSNVKSVEKDADIPLREKISFLLGRKK